MISLAVTIDLRTINVIRDHGCISWKNKEIYLIPPHCVKSISEVILDTVLARVLVQTTSPLEALKKKPLF
jgi:hypothetical protein